MTRWLLGLHSVSRSALSRARMAAMNQRKTRLAALLFVAVLFVAVLYLAPNAVMSRIGWLSPYAVRAQNSEPFTFTDFDAKDAGTGLLQGTMGTSINDNGDVTGIYLNTNGTATNVAHGFIRTADGTITEFDSPHAGTGKNQGTFPASINANGEIAGMYFDANNAYHGFLRSTSGTITEFDVPGAPTNVGHRGTLPLSINSGGDIAGLWVDDANDVRHGFVRTAAGVFTSFDVSGAGTAPTQGTVPLSINAAGTTTGFYEDAAANFHAFLRAADGTMTAPIDAPGAGTGGSGKLSFSGTLATSINTAGDIAGVYANGGDNHGFVYTSSSTTPAFTTFDAPSVVLSGVFMGTLGASMNAGGDVSGVYTDGQGDHHGFVRAANGTFTSPVDDPNSVYTTAFSGTILISINAAGQMTGTYQDANYAFHAFLAVPAQSSAAAPTFSPAAGTYTSVQTVTISDSMADATIYYTTDGSTPTTSSTKYTASITVSSTETIKAIATVSGYSNSTVASATYTINLPAPDFQLTVNPSTLSIVQGQSGTATFTVTPVNGFTAAVSFGCNGLPAEATCTFNPASVTPNGSPITSTLTVSTTAKSAAVRAPGAPRQGTIFATLLPLLILMVGAAAGRKQTQPRSTVLCLLVLVLVTSGLVSCGGSNSNTSSGNSGTPLGTSTLSVSAAATGGSTQSHTATLTITITQ